MESRYQVSGALSLFLCVHLYAENVTYLENPIYLASAQEVDEFMGLLDEATAMATKHKLNIDDTPSTVTVIRQEEIEAMGARNLYEALALLPGMEKTISNIGTKYFVVRGQKNVPYTGYDKTKLLIDGMPFENHATGSIAHFMEFPAELIERIEVMRGASSALYGPGAYGGVVNVITHTSHTDENSVWIQSGSDGFVRATAKVQQQVGETKLYLDAFRESEGGDIHEQTQFGPFAVDVTGDESLRYAGVGFHLERDHLHFQTRYIDKTSGNHLGFAEIGEPQDDKEQHNQIWMGEISYTFQKDHLDGEIKIGGNYQKSNNGFRFFPESLLQAYISPSIEGDYLYNIESEEHNLYVEGFLNYDGIDQHTMTVGISAANSSDDENYLEDNRRYMGEIIATGQSDLSPDVIDRYDDLYLGNNDNLSRFSVYLQDLYHATEALDLIGTLRLDSYEGAFDTQFSYHFGTIYRLDEHNRFKFSLANAHRLPTRLESSGGSDLFVAPVSSRDLEVEKAMIFEMGYSYKPDNSQRYSINFWHMKTENWIDTATFVETVDGQTYSNITFANYDDQHTSGIELEALFQPADKLNVLANFSYSETHTPQYIDGELYEGEMAAPWLAKMLCSYQATANLQTDLWIYHRSHIKDSFTHDGVVAEVQRLPSHTSVDFGLRYAYNQDLNIKLGVQNLFDDELLVVSHNEAFLEGAPRGERRFYGGFSYRF